MYLKKIYFLLFSALIVGSSLSAEAESLDAGIDFKSQDPLFVSLGSFCGPASIIQTAGLRKASFPLDWTLSVDGEMVIKLLEDNFSHFFDINQMAPSSAGNLLHKYYHLEFVHDGDFSGIKFYHNMPAFVEKYCRRIERFRKLNQYKGKVFFVRFAWPLSTHPNYAFKDTGNLEISKGYSIRLYAVLQKLFPALDVHLVIVNTPKDGEIVPMKIIDKIVILKTLTPNLNEIAELYAN